eukprot:scaffold11398_cov137-Alexandrium_tamarense.AAC.1
MQPAVHPLTITLPDGQCIHSTHTCNLDIPWLPPAATKAHIVPGLAHTSLISIKQLCDNGCRVIYDDMACRVYYQHQLVWIGQQEPTMGLWILPLQPNRPNASNMTAYQQQYEAANLELANNAYTMTSKSELIKFLHQCAFSPTIPTWIKAIDNGQFSSWPGLTSAAVRKYLPPSPATDKGHMKRLRQNIRSTRPKQHSPSTTAEDNMANRLKQLISEELDANPPAEKMEEGNGTNVFCFAAIADKIEGTVYVDNTGRFPVRSLEGHLYLFILYDYGSNAILVEALKTMESKEFIAAFQKKISYLTQRGFKPRFNVIDNIVSKAVQSFLEEHQIGMQIVEPHNHRVNAAERAIQTFKDHYIAGLSTTDKDFPLQLWDQLLEQAQDSLNMLRTSRVNPRLSAYHVLEGPHDFNRMPWAPPGTKAVIYDAADARTSWAPRGTDGFYVGPAKQHYRCYRFYTPETGGYRTSAKATFYPSHCRMPTETALDRLGHTAVKLTNILAKLSTQPTIASRHLTALKQLTDIFADMTKQQKHITEGTIQRVSDQGRHKQQQRVEEEVQPTTSTNPTRKNNIIKLKLNHLRHTRRNTPNVLKPSEATITDTTYAPIFYDEQVMPSATPNPSSVPPRRSQRISLRSPAIISQEAVNFITEQTWNNTQQMLPLSLQNTPNMEHFAAPVIHPTSGETITDYRKLMKDPATAEIWTKAFGKEIGSLAQGDDLTGTKGTDTIVFLDRIGIKNIPKDRVITYARIVVDYRPQKEDPNRVRITAGGNLINYPGELTTRTADLTTAKLMWNSVISTDNARYACYDVKNFYLGTPLDRYEYMRIPLHLIPQHIIDQYDLTNKALNGFVYVEIRKGIYGLPQAGMLANKLLKERLAPHGYLEVRDTPGLFIHKTRPIMFTLVVDDFGVKYVGKEHADHLVSVLKRYYTLSEDWTGSLYCGVSLKWNYKERWVDINMPGYIKNALQRYNHEPPDKQQHCPYPPQPKKYGSDAQEPKPIDTSPILDKDGITRIQQIVGTISYYARAVDITILTALNTIGAEQAQATQNTALTTKQLLDYLATHPDTTIRYYASDMIMNVHSNAAYLVASGARSRAAGHFFLGWTPQDNKPIKLNGAFYTTCELLKFVAGSAAEAELGALFLNAQKIKIFRHTLEEMGHPQPPTPTHCDNTTA